MIIDSSVVINTTQDTDHRIKNKDEIEEIRPVEEIDNGNGAQLDLSRDRIEDKKTEAGSRDTGTIYGNKGEIRNEVPDSDSAAREGLNLDIFV